MGVFKEIVVDAEVPSKLARFWAEALDGYEVMAYDDHEIARLAEFGLTPETDPSVMVVGPGTRLCFQLHLGQRSARNRIHFDIAASDVEKEVQRLQSLGAVVIRRSENYTVLADIEGNNFCVTR